MKANLGRGILERAKAYSLREFCEDAIWRKRQRITRMKANFGRGIFWGRDILERARASGLWEFYEDAIW